MTILTETRAQLDGPTDPAGEPRTSVRRKTRAWFLGAVLLALLAGSAVTSGWRGNDKSSAAIPPTLPQVTISTPLQQTVSATTGFLGQFSAIDTVELRAQVGGALTEIAFHDG